MASTEKRSRTVTIHNWKKRGLLVDDYYKVYQLWLDSTHCDKCACQYTEENKKCMDHCHRTGRFRGIVCHNCNCNMLDHIISKNNTSGHKNIYHNKKYDGYKYEKIYYGKKISKYFKTKVKALCYKYIILLRIQAGHFN